MTNNKNATPLTLTKSPRALDSFLKGEEAHKEEKIETPKQSNIRWTEEERKSVDLGLKACLDKMPLYKYLKTAVLEKAQKDIEERKQIDAMRANLKK